MHYTDHEKQLFRPSDAMWAEPADAMAEEGVGVTSIVASGSPSFVEFAFLDKSLLGTFNNRVPRALSARAILARVSQMGKPPWMCCTLTGPSLCFTLILAAQRSMLVIMPTAAVFHIFNTSAWCFTRVATENGECGF